MGQHRRADGAGDGLHRLFLRHRASAPLGMRPAPGWQGGLLAALPVVGKIVAGAADTVAAGAVMLRTGVGCWVSWRSRGVRWPFLALAVHYLVYKAARRWARDWRRPGWGSSSGTWVRPSAWCWAWWAPER